MMKFMTRFLAIRYKALIKRLQQQLIEQNALMLRVERERKEARLDANKYYEWYKSAKEGSGYVYKSDLDVCEDKVKRLQSQVKELANTNLKLAESTARIEILERVNRDLDARLKTRLCRVGGGK